MNEGFDYRDHLTELEQKQVSDLTKHINGLTEAMELLESKCEEYEKERGALIHLAAVRAHEKERGEV